ncbi:hypothetical protein TWF696_007555 [Orbilia brochopaga]|uniref:Ankyrin n=1 Tax=Orbilia brochopaga TaxID=3140254 RepID=A0AAV9UKH0_9PEZI
MDYTCLCDKTALLYAIESSNEKCCPIARLLIESGADVNLGCGFAATTPLLAAFDRSDLAMAKLLIDRGANPITKGYRPISALHPLIKQDKYLFGRKNPGPNEEAILILLKSAYAPQLLALDNIVSSLLVVNAEERFSEAFDVGLGLAITHLLESAPEETRTACRKLYRAIGIDNDLGLVREIVETYGANNKYFRFEDFSPLFYALSLRLGDIVRILLENGADPEAEWNGNTAIFFSVERGYDDMVEILIEESVNIEALNQNGETPLLRAVNRNRISNATVKVLLHHGANTEATDSQGLTALLIASRSSADEAGALVEDLVDHGANLEAEFSYGLTPLANSIIHNKSRARIKIMLDRGAKVDYLVATTETIVSWWVKWVGGEDTKPLVTPLALAAYRGDLEIMVLLLDHGASIEGLKGSCRTPMQAAAISNNAEAVKLLINRGARIENQISPAEITVFASPLYAGAIYGSWQAMKALLDAGAGREHSDTSGLVLLEKVNEGIKTVERKLRLPIEKGIIDFDGRQAGKRDKRLRLESEIAEVTQLLKKHVDISMLQNFHPMMAEDTSDASEQSVDSPEDDSISSEREDCCTDGEGSQSTLDDQDIWRIRTALIMKNSNSIYIVHSWPSGLSWGQIAKWDSFHVLR